MLLGEPNRLGRVERSDIEDRRGAHPGRLEPRGHVDKVSTVRQELGPGVIQVAPLLPRTGDAYKRAAIGGHSVNAIEILREEDRAITTPGGGTIRLRGSYGQDRATSGVDFLQQA